MNKRRGTRLFLLVLSLILALTLVTGCGRSDKKKGNGRQLIHTESSDSKDSKKSKDSKDSKAEDEDEEESGRSKADQKKLDQDIEDGYLILVNKDKENHISSSYKPEDLEHVKYYAADRSEEGRYLRAEASKQFQKLSEDAAEEGLDIVVTTAYRSYSFQSVLFNNYVKQKGEAEANKTSARPGESEHQTGLAADLSCKAIDYRNSSDFGNTEEGKWVAENCYKYGFIIRFPNHQEGITGYTYEPWHIRYVGKTAAKEIFDEDITLEEYIEENDLDNSIPESAKPSDDTSSSSEKTSSSN